MKTMFATSLGSKAAATSMMVDVTLSDGSTGLGETPTSFSLPHETVAAISEILNEARNELTGMPIDAYPQKVSELRNRHPEFRMTASGLEVALFRASLAARGKSEHAYWGRKLRTIETDITIPFTTDADVLSRWLGRIGKVGFTTYKIKVSGNVDADIALLRRVRDTLARQADANGGSNPVIRLDGNQGYTQKTYLKMTDLLLREKWSIELFEQPLPKRDYAGMKATSRRSPVPIVLDETVCDSTDCRRVIDEGLGDGVNIKIAKSGIAESAAILKLARSAGLKLMLGCMTETMVGLSAAIYLAAGTDAFDYLDLDSIHFLFHPRRFGSIVIDGATYRL